MKGQRVLITGSEGLIGKILARALYKEHNLVLLDKKDSAQVTVDLSEDFNNFKRYFKDVETAIHLAANSSPFLDKEAAQENIIITRGVLEACRQEEVKRLIYASSINVYPYKELYKSGVQIRENTPPSPQKWGGDNRIYYGASKIKCEQLVEYYHKRTRISALNLRLGSVTSENKPLNDIADFAIWLSHEDLLGILKKALEFTGFASLVCVSNNSDKFVDINPIKKVLDYVPKSNSADYKHKK